MAERSGSLDRLKARQEALEQAINNLPVHALTPDSRARLLKLVRAEGKFVERLVSHRLAVSSSRLSSTNFGHLEAVIQILQHPLVSGASGVLQTFSAYATKEPAAGLKSENYVTAHVDVVCSFDGKPVWVVTSTRNPKYISWWGDGNEKGLRSRMLSLLMAACEDVVVQPAFILLCFAGKLDQVTDRKLESEFDALKVGSYSERSTESSYLASKQPPLHIDCSQTEDEDDDWVEITTGEDDTGGTGEASGENLEDQPDYAKEEAEAKADTAVKPSPPSAGNFWTTYLIRVSRVKLAELLATPAMNFDRPPESTEEAMQLDKHVCSSDYTGRGGNIQDIMHNTQTTAAPVVWSEEDTTQYRLDKDLVFSSLAQSLSEIHVSMRKMGRQPVQSDLSGKSLVNLDTTALIALVSQLSNGGALLFSQMDNQALQKRFGNMWSFIKDQAKSELENPLVPEMEAVLATRVAVVSQFALDEFQSIISVVGGPQEKQRASLWLSRLRVLPNMPSVRVMALDETGKVKERHKIVFGTGDFWHAPTLTANISFVRAARNTGMALAAIEHRPRALTGD